MTDFLNYVVIGLLTGELYALIAMGFVVVYRASKVFNFAQGELVVLGGFLVWSAATQFGMHPLVAVIVALAVGIAIGWSIERVFFSRLVGRSVFAMVMITIGLIIFLRGVMLTVWSAQDRQFPAIFSLEPITLGGLFLPRSLVIGAITAAVCALGLNWFFNHSRAGLGLAAVSEDHQVARSLGVSVKRSIAVAWMMGVALSVIGASIYLSGKSLSFDVAEIGFAAIPIALLAGIESILGLLLAGAIVGIVQGLTSAYLDPYVGTQASAVLPYIVMLIVLLVRPTGLFGWKTIERV